MRILNEDRTSSVSAGSALSGFSADNVENDRPRKPWISTAKSGETFTISLDASISYPIEAFFLYGIEADSCSWTLKNQAESTVDFGTLNMTYPLESDLSGNTNNSNVYFVKQVHFRRAFFITFSNPVTDNGSLVLTLATSVNMGAKNIAGNSVASWVRDATNKGRLLDSSGSAINIIDHGFIGIGTHVTAVLVDNPVTTDTTVSQDSNATSVLVINGGVTLTINGGFSVIISTDPITAQITSITGDRTASQSITLNVDLGTASVANILNPIKIGIARCGKLTNIPNPRRGLSFGYQDFSVRRRQPTGGYSSEQRPLARVVSGDCIMTTAEAQTMQDFYRAFRSKPMPMLFINDMPTSFGETMKGNMFGYFKNAPSFSMLGPEHQADQFQFCEVV